MRLLVTSLAYSFSAPDHACPGFCLRLGIECAGLLRSPFIPDLGVPLVWGFFPERHHRQPHCARVVPNTLQESLWSP